MAGLLLMLRISLRGSKEGRDKPLSHSQGGKVLRIDSLASWTCWFSGLSSFLLSPWHQTLEFSEFIGEVLMATPPSLQKVWRKMGSLKLLFFKRHLSTGLLALHSRPSSGSPQKLISERRWHLSLFRCKLPPGKVMLLGGIWAYCSSVWHLTKRPEILAVSWTSGNTNFFQSISWVKISISQTRLRGEWIISF